MKFQSLFICCCLASCLAGCQSTSRDPLAFNEVPDPAVKDDGSLVLPGAAIAVPVPIIPVKEAAPALRATASAGRDKTIPQKASSPKPSTVTFPEWNDQGVIEADEDEIENGEELFAVDDMPLEGTLGDFNIDSGSGAKSNPLLCHDSIFYQSWSTQFDAQWIEKQGTRYRGASERNHALAQARTSAFTHMVYPALEKTGYDLPLEMNPQVMSWVAYFTGAGRKNFSLWLERGRTFIPEMQKILEKNGLPSDLVYLSMIESGYSTKSLSSVGAVGLWQFMPATGREYGLRINDWLDERRDARKSTLAASRYLTDLYARFGSWHLAAAGYNGGPGLMQRTLRNYGQTASFFDLTSKNRINSQTANYVPKILAAMIVAKNASLFGFEGSFSSLPSVTRTVPVYRSVALDDLARAIQVDKAVLASLNPQLRLGITPPATATAEGYYELVVPAPKAELALASLKGIPDAPTSHLVSARIKRLEKVAAFAKRYRVSVASLLQANKNLTARSSLRKGQLVFISVKLGSGQYDRMASVKFVHHKSHKKLVHAVVSKQKRHSFVKAKKRKTPHIAFVDKH